MKLAPSLPMRAIHKIAVLKIDLIPMFYKMIFKCTCPQSELRIYHFIKAFKNVDVNESNTVFYSFEKCAVTLSWMIKLKDLCRLKWKYWNARRINIRFFHWVAKGDTNWAWKRLNYGFFFNSAPHCTAQSLLDLAHAPLSKKRTQCTVVQKKGSTNLHFSMFLPKKFSPRRRGNSVKGNKCKKWQNRACKWFEKRVISTVAF